MRWQDQNRYVSESECKTVGLQIKKFYEENSRGKMEFSRINGEVIRVPYNAAKKNINKAERYCMSKAKGYDYYGIINNGVKDFSNAGRNIMHLEGALVRTALHEFGHLIDLQHSGVETKNGYDSYGDNLSVMGRYPSNTLASNQYLYKKWITKEDTIVYDKPGDYTLQNLMSIEGIKILLLGESFVSYVRGKIAIHKSYAEGKGSRRVGLIKKKGKYLEYNIEVKSKTPSEIIISISE